MPTKVAVIGCGVMGQALALRLPSECSLILCDRTQEKMDLIQKERPSAVTTSDSSKAVQSAEVVLLCVKPQSIAETLAECASYFSSTQMVISIASGITLEGLQSSLETLGASLPILVRVMPNTAIRVEKGVIAHASQHPLTTEQQELLDHLFSPMGLLVSLQEEMIDAVTALCSCSPAYLYTVIDAMIRAGLSLGFEQDEAYSLVKQTVLGAVALWEKENKQPALLCQEICSPAGSTIYGLRALEEQGAPSAVVGAIQTAHQRSVSLGQQFHNGGE